ncbi:hypothetical protein ES288_D05G419800v1 [Gossypium darwinii]|uniref:Uncharacterized protein n=1 Tax=Gossypium darwinii TaxID=34276 RepID=A0A5D2CSW3_GOSDA|nr:hypothetical protein ES288_D05G419800v1 [Gossypium darwinii]
MTQNKDVVQEDYHKANPTPTKQRVVNLIHMPSETKAQPNPEQKWTITTSMKRCFTTHTTSRPPTNYF